jgi:hypothetical protein
MSKKMHWATTVMAMIAILAAFAFYGCSSSSSGSGSGSGLQVSQLTVNPTTVEVGATTVVEATVTDGTNPMPNRVVWFQVEPSSAGYFSPGVDTTGTDGTVSTVFTALSDGTVSIIAVLNDNVSENISLAVSEQSHTGTGNVDLVIVPTMIMADGQSTAQLTVTIRDANGDPVPDNTPVRFTAGEYFIDLDGNGYWTVGADSLVYDNNNNGTWDAIGLIPSTAYVTGGAGQVSVDYTASTEATTVYITVRVDPASGITGYSEATIQLTPNASVSSFYLGSEDIHLAVKRTGGMETTTLFAIGYDAFGNPVPEGVQVSFIITDGPDDTDDGEHLAALNGASRRGPYATTTNSNGVAECPISSGTVSGTIRIRAYSDTVLSNATHVMVHAGPPANIVVAGKKCNVPFWEEVNRENEVVAVVSDIYNNPVGDSTAVYFTCDEGTIMAHMERTKNEAGVVESKWVSGYDDPTADGVVWIYAETSGGTVVDSSYFINSGIPVTLWIEMGGPEPFPTSIYADGVTMKFFVVETRDINGNFCVDETEIDLEADYVAVSSGFSRDGCHASKLRPFLTSVILDYDHSTNGLFDDSIGAIDVISTTYKGFYTISQVCTLRTGPAYREKCLVNIPGSVSSGRTVTFSAVIKDRWGNLLADHELVATADYGVIANGTQYTDIYGEANGFSYTAPPTIDSITAVVISVSDNDPAGGIIFFEEVTVNLQ